jgi:DNA adenine methylase
MKLASQSMPPELTAADIATVTDVDTKSSLRPPLKWAGGKRWQIPHLRPLWREHNRRRLVEPFCGGLAVTLGLSPEKALLNDVNPHLVNFYQWLKRGLVTALLMSNTPRRYYDCRTRFNKLLERGQATSQEAAALFYYLNRTGYNGLCRFNQKGGFNVPFGRYTHITYTYDFIPYRETFARWDFMNMDFERLPLNAHDFIYADPPYDVEFTHYSKEKFNWEEQVRTAEWLSKHPGPVVLSNQATDRIVALYKQFGFKLTYLPAPRMISCTGDRTPAREVLATKNL